MWRTKRGQIFRPKEFEDQHLLNTIKFLQRRNEEINSGLTEMMDDDYNDDYAVSEMMDLTPEERWPIFRKLVREAQRRALPQLDPELRYVAKALKRWQKAHAKLVKLEDVYERLGGPPDTWDRFKVSREGKKIVIQFDTTLVSHNTSPMGLRFYVDVDTATAIADRLGDVITGMEG